jgi:hypothetical protein
MASAGEYDDYRVLAVFARREDAQAYVDRHNGLDRYDRRREHFDRAFVEDIPFRPAGVVHPDDEVIDVEIVTHELEGTR